MSKCKRCGYMNEGNYKNFICAKCDYVNEEANIVNVHDVNSLMGIMGEK